MRPWVHIIGRLYSSSSSYLLRAFSVTASGIRAIMAEKPRRAICGDRGALVFQNELSAFHSAWSRSGHNCRIADVGCPCHRDIICTSRLKMARSPTSRLEGSSENMCAVPGMGRKDRIYLRIDAGAFCRAVDLPSGGGCIATIGIIATLWTQRQAGHLQHRSGLAVPGHGVHRRARRQRHCDQHGRQGGLAG
jgi:hypothetical protein